jgi:hypothetical protein
MARRGGWAGSGQDLGRIWEGTQVGKLSCRAKMGLRAPMGLVVWCPLGRMGSLDRLFLPSAPEISQASSPFRRHWNRLYGALPSWGHFSRHLSDATEACFRGRGRPGAVFRKTADYAPGPASPLARPPLVDFPCVLRPFPGQRSAELSYPSYPSYPMRRKRD